MSKQNLLKLIESLPEGTDLSAAKAELQKLVPAYHPFFSLTTGSCSVFERDFGPDFELLEEGPQALDNPTFSLVPYIRSTDLNGYIMGDELRKRAVLLGGNRGQHDGDKIVKLQSKIPIEYRRNHQIPLPGTLYRHLPSQKLYIPFLDGLGVGVKWRCDLRCLEDDFSRFGRLLVPGKVVLKP